MNIFPTQKWLILRLETVAESGVQGEKGRKANVLLFWFSITYFFFYGYINIILPFHRDLHFTPMVEIKVSIYKEKTAMWIKKNSFRKVKDDNILKITHRDYWAKLGVK